MAQAAFPRRGGDVVERNDIADGRVGVTSGEGGQVVGGGRPGLACTSRTEVLRSVELGEVIGELQARRTPALKRLGSLATIGEHTVAIVSLPQAPVGVGSGG